jgi:hypothetical protein
MFCTDIIKAVDFLLKIVYYIVYYLSGRCFMSHLTLYLDRETESLIRVAARESNISVSRWVASTIKRVTRSTWPAEVRRMAGAWPDFPSAEKLRESSGKDMPRENF